MVAEPVGAGRGAGRGAAFGAAFVALNGIVA
jgi:hypothetical protein